MYCCFFAGVSGKQERICTVQRTYGNAENLGYMVLISYRDMLQDDVSSGCSMKQMLDCHWNRFDDMETLSGIC